jgi:hypothetical protein
VPYAIDFMNPAPDADVHSVGETNFRWIVEKMADLAIRKAQDESSQGAELLWSRFLSGGASATSLGSGAGPGDDITRAALMQRAAAKKAVRASAKKTSAKKTATRRPS